MAERTVQFWHVTDPFHNPLPGIFPGAVVASKLKALTGEDRYVETTDGMRLLSKVFREAAPQHVALYRVRRDNLPSLERNAELADLALPADQNLAEATHFRFFGRNVVGMLFNNDGPRMGRMAGYLEKTIGVQVSFAPVLDSDTARRLDQMGFLTKIDVGLPVARAHLLDSVTGDATDIPRVLREMGEASRVKTLHVGFTIWGGGPAAESGARNFLRGVIRSPALGAFTKLAAKSRATAQQPGQTVDFVKEQLAMTETVDLRSTGSRIVTDASARKAIENAYEQLKFEIESSVAPVPDQLLTIQSLAPSH